MHANKPTEYSQCEKVICDWTDKKKYLVHYQLLQFYVRYGRVIDNFQERISFKEAPWLEKNINFITAKRNKTNDFEKDFTDYKIMH